MSGSGLVIALSEVPESNIVDDQKLRARPGSEALRIGAICKPCMEIVEKIDAASVAHGHALLAGTQAEGFEDVTFSSAGFAGNDYVFSAPDEIETSELEDGALVERRLKSPVEGFEGLAFGEAAGRDAALDACLAFRTHLFAQQVLEQLGVTGSLATGPSQQVADMVLQVSESEELKVADELGELWI